MQPRLTYYAVVIGRAERTGRDATQHRRRLNAAIAEYEEQHGRGAGLRLRHDVSEIIAREALEVRCA